MKYKYHNILSSQNKSNLKSRWLNGRASAWHTGSPRFDLPHLQLKIRQLGDVKYLCPKPWRVAGSLTLMDKGSVSVLGSFMCEIINKICNCSRSHFRAFTCTREYNLLVGHNGQ